jgi:LysR family transcriptional regulator, cyn operon transcriptional activator
MHINLELYRVFYFAAKSGSLSKASQLLFISQPAVSQAIKQLEDKLGGQLFFRTSKGIKLTREGETVYKYIEPAYNFIVAAEVEFTEMLDLSKGAIKIGASDMSCKYYLLPYLESFHKVFPKIKIHLTNGPTPETIDQLKKGLIDFGIISLPIEEDNRLVVKEVMSIQDCFVAGENYIELKGRTVSLSELLRYPILLLEKATSTRKYIEDHVRKYSLTLNPEIELATSDLLVEFARKGFGISCVVRNFAQEDIEKSNLFEIQLKDAIPPRQIGIVTLKDAPLSAAAKKFIGNI